MAPPSLSNFTLIFLLQLSFVINSLHSTDNLKVNVPFKEHEIIMFYIFILYSISKLNMYKYTDREGTLGYLLHVVPNIFNNIFLLVGLTTLGA